MSNPATDTRTITAGSGALSGALARPRVLALGCIVALVAAGWAYLGLVLAGQRVGGILAVLCGPVSGTAGAAGIALTFAMWCAMVLAMMLPTAGPMIVTYSQLAETAAEKGEPAASPLALTGGYLAVWLAGAAGLTALQLVLARLWGLDASLISAGPLLAGALFLVAGLYQFSTLKYACLKQCQHPLPFFFGNWTARARGIFGLGVRQGLYCLGCCWAMMLLMFTLGVMNVVWMALLGIVMTIEKLDTSMRFTRAVGIVFMVAGAALIGQAVIVHWPASVS
jgi:predicted metal-binding membrane protein